MKPSPRVVWQEGMHLAQHHFQLQSRYFEDSLAFALAQLNFSPYGLAACELDAEALRNGTVAITHARGVMPDGLAFQIPEADSPPPPRQIRPLFSPTQDSQVVAIGVPAYKPSGANCVFESGQRDGDLRFVAERRLIADETTGQDEKPVLLGRKNLRVLLDSEVRDGVVALALARVRRDGQGQFVYDPDFIPPLLDIGASPGLLRRLRRIVEMLEAKSEALGGRRTGPGAEPGGWATRDVASFWLAHAVHSSLAPLRHLLEAKRVHPEQLYSELARLAGALCTFSLGSDPRALPLYDHENLEACFGALEGHIRSHLNLVVPTNSIALPLERARKYLYTCTIQDRRCLGPSTWILGVTAPHTARHDLPAAVPRLMKVSALESITRLVKEAQPGLTLEHLPSAPPAVVARPGAQYFEIRQEGVRWDALVKSGQVGIYVPEALADAELDLVVVLGTGGGPPQ